MKVAFHDYFTQNILKPQNVPIWHRLYGDKRWSSVCL